MSQHSNEKLRLVEIIKRYVLTTNLIEVKSFHIYFSEI